MLVCNFSNPTLSSYITIRRGTSFGFLDVKQCAFGQMLVEVVEIENDEIIHMNKYCIMLTNIYQTNGLVYWLCALHYCCTFCISNVNSFNLFRCDRILWHGDGIVQLSYFRGESKFSDHRPVCGTFIVDVEIQESRSKRRSSNTNIRIGAEELLPTSKSKANKNKGNKGMQLLDS